MTGSTQSHSHSQSHSYPHLALTLTLTLTLNVNLNCLCIYIVLYFVCLSHARLFSTALLRFCALIQMLTPPIITPKNINFCNKLDPGLVTDTATASSASCSGFVEEMGLFGNVTSSSSPSSAGRADPMRSLYTRPKHQQLPSITAEL